MPEIQNIYCDIGICMWLVQKWIWKFRYVIKIIAN
jgi:hypothetical protein